MVALEACLRRCKMAAFILCFNNDDDDDDDDDEDLIT